MFLIMLKYLIVHLMVYQLFLVAGATQNDSLVDGRLSSGSESLSWWRNAAEHVKRPVVRTYQTVKNGVSKQVVRPMVIAYHKIETEVSKLVEPAVHIYQKAKGFVKERAKELGRININNPNLRYPGTKWCGPGNRSLNDEDLGLFKKTDTCCRSHDKCAEVIEPGQSKYGLHNDGRYIKLHCDCDQEFFHCLTKSGPIAPWAVSFIYFHAHNPKCFKKDENGQWKWYKTPKYF